MLEAAHAIGREYSRVAKKPTLMVVEDVHSGKKDAITALHCKSFCNDMQFNVMSPQGQFYSTAILSQASVLLNRKWVFTLSASFSAGKVKMYA